MSPFHLTSCIMLPCLQTHATLHTCTLWTSVSTHRFIHTNMQTHKWLQISQWSLREFREWRVIWLKRTKLQETRIIDPPLWPNLQSVPEISWRKKENWRKLAGEGNVWASINRRPMFEMILKGMQSFIIELILLHVYHIEWVKETYKPCMPLWNLDLFSDNSRFQTSDRPHCGFMKDIKKCFR